MSIDLLSMTTDSGRSPLHEKVSREYHFVIFPVQHRPTSASPAEGIKGLEHTLLKISVTLIIVNKNTAFFRHIVSVNPIKSLRIQTRYVFKHRHESIVPPSTQPPVPF